MSDPSPAPTAPSRDQLSEMAVYVRALEGIVDAANKAMRARLLPELIAMHDAGEGKTIEASALGLDGAAKITLTVPEKGTYQVTDPAAFHDYVDRIDPEQIQMVFVVDPAWETEFLKTLAVGKEGAVISPDGATVPGVTYKPPAAPSRISVTIDKHKAGEVVERVLESFDGLTETVNFTKAIEAGSK